MIELELDGRTISYYPQGESVPPEVTAKVMRYNFRDDSMTMFHPRVRQIVFPWRIAGRDDPDRLLLMSLHWDDDTDLQLLDQLAQDGADISDALERAVTCEVHEPMCRNCDNRSIVMVVAHDMPGGSVEAQRCHTTSTTCPNCDDPNYVEHVEVLQ